MEDIKVRKVSGIRTRSESRIKKAQKRAENKRQFIGLWDLLVAGGLYCSAYVLYFQDSISLKVFAGICGLKATQIAYERFVK